MTAGKTVLAIRDLTHGFNGNNVRREGAIQVITPISLDIERGDFVSLVGPSGCGKTTLLRILAGLVRPKNGTITDCRGPISGPDWRRSLVFQDAQLFPWLTVEQNIAFGPRHRSISKSVYGPRIDELIHLVRLESFRNAYPHQLSGGMRQRVALARGLANEPHILLLDEPLGALDALTREQMQDELRTIWRRTGCTMVLVTHSVEEALYLSTRVVVLSDRPMAIIKELGLDFSRNVRNGEGRQLKSSPEFLALREEVLGIIWGSGQ